MPDFVIDSIDGDDGNSGEPGSPFRTPAPLTIEDNMRIGFVDDSEWRYQFGLEAAALNDVKVRRLARPGSLTNKMPIWRGDDIIDNELWAPIGGLSFSYEVTLPHAAAAGQLQSLWRNDIRIRWVASEAIMDATPGTMFVDTTGAGGTSRICVHPPGSADPRIEGAKYEYAARHFGLVDGRASNRWQVIGVHTMRSLKTDGSFGLFSQGGYARHILAEDGTRHSIIVANGTIEDFWCWKCDWADRGAVNPFIGADNPAAGKLVIARRGVVKVDPQRVIDSANGITGFLAHGSAANDKYANVIFEDCTAEGCDTGFGASSTVNFTVTRCKPYDCIVGVTPSADANTVTDLFVDDGPNLQLTIGINVSLGVPVLVDGYRENGEGAAAALQSILATNAAAVVTVRQSVFYAPSVATRGYVFSQTNGAQMISEGNIFHGNTNQRAYRNGTTGGSADRNLYFPSNINFNYGGVESTDFASWRVAQPTFDVNSTTGDPLFIDPANGNFNVGASSPAIALGAGLERPNIVYTPIPTDLELAAM